MMSVSSEECRLAHEESVFLLLHQMIDDMFIKDKEEQEEEGSTQQSQQEVDMEQEGNCKQEVEGKKSDPEEEEDLSVLPPLPSSPPTLETFPYEEKSTRTSSVFPTLKEEVVNIPPPPKRRRLGVNAGAHEQILRLRDSLAYVTEERDEWRKKCKEAQETVTSLENANWRWKSELTSLKRAVAINGMRGSGGDGDSGRTTGRKGKKLEVEMMGAGGEREM